MSAITVKVVTALNLSAERWQGEIIQKTSAPYAILHERIFLIMLTGSSPNQPSLSIHRKI
ncbi:MAG: hypothetical protein CMH06_05175 [Marinovum sp.]|nr:hypothetical protein [Marinovum sp.]